ncbi:MAG: RNA polymerase sigma-54 factor, partial [Pseudomonadota bacterium]
MALAAKLELRQGQQLVMTPQLQQAIKLLQLSNIELSEFIETELERNPLLEREGTTATDDFDGDYSPPEQGAGKDEPGDTSPNALSSADQGADDLSPLNDRASDAMTAAPEAGSQSATELAADPTDATGVLDTDYGTLYPDTAAGDFVSDLAGSNWAQSNSGGSFTADGNDLEGYVSEQLSLKDHVFAQIPLTIADGQQRLIAHYLVDYLDDAGYLKADLIQVADKLGTTRAAIEEVVNALQKLEPVGVFARSLNECLSLQLRERNRYDPIIARLLENLDLLANHNMN